MKVGMDRFNISRHNKINNLIHNHLNTRLIEENKFYFGGGTLCSMKYGEYRESVDIDFLTCDRNGMINMRLGENLISELPLWKGKQIKSDKDGIRFWVDFRGEAYKIEFIFESRIVFNEPVRFETILSLDPVSHISCKLLANADRGCGGELQAHKDIIDILVLYEHHGKKALTDAWHMAYEAYGSWLVRCTEKSMQLKDFTKTLEILRMSPNLNDKFLMLMHSFSADISELIINNPER